MTVPVRRRTRRLAPNQSGTVAVEFALLLPIMITLFLCCLEVTNLVMAYLRVNAAVQTAADLVSQQQKTLQNADVIDYASGAQDIMFPLPAANLTVAFASVVWAGGVPSPSTNGTSAPNAAGSWHQEIGATAIPVATVTAIANRVCTATDPTTNTVITAICNNGDSVVIAQVYYAYSSPFSWLIPGTYNFVDTAISRPRFVTFIPHA
jgi:Flp pilus assembly protein TadG